jgi:uncharacterized protein YjbI with pentapeptide repeats
MASGLNGRETFDGVVFDEDVVFDNMTFCASTSFRGAKFRGNASFLDTRFEGDVSFEGAVFKRDAWFGHTRFCGNVSFDEAKFRGAAGFDSARFDHDVRFGSTLFKGDVILGRVSVGGDALFCDARVHGDIGVEEAVFDGRAEFCGARLERSAVFDRSVFTDQVDFSEASFGGTVRFSEVGFLEQALFRAARFADAVELGPLFASELDFERALFEQPAQMIFACPRASFRGTAFREGVDVHARWAALDLQSCDFGCRPSLVAAMEDAHDATGFLDREELHGHLWQRRLRDAACDQRPRIATLQQAKVEALTVSGADLRECRFVGAHGLERMRLERCEFSRTPIGWQRRRHDRRQIRWTKRMTLADEHQWRAHATQAPGWASGAPPHPLRVPTAEQVATAYRALRKGREENKDEPGAADFYYGEMEMRRERSRLDRSAAPAHRTHRGESALLWLYWLISGYALRPTRVFATLAAVIVIFAALFSYVGFTDPSFTPAPVEVSSSGSLVYAAADNGRTELEDAVEATTFAAGTATAILAAPERPLEPEGSVLRVVLRILGPILVGLAVLSIRGRVKR